MPKKGGKRNGKLLTKTRKIYTNSVKSSLQNTLQSIEEYGKIITVGICVLGKITGFLITDYGVLITKGSSGNFCRISWDLGSCCVVLLRKETNYES